MPDKPPEVWTPPAQPTPNPTTLGVNTIIGVPNANRSAAAHKAWETRRRNAAEQEPKAGGKP